MNEHLEARQRRREALITISFTIFSVLMIIVTTVEDWPVFYIPLISFEVAFIWWSYIRGFHSYAARAFIVTGATCINIILYGIEGESFMVLIPTLCVEFVLLSLYEMTQIMGVAIIQSAILMAYHLIINTEVMIPHTSIEKNRFMLQLLSFIILIALCIYRIRHHVQEEEDFANMEDRVRKEQKIKDDFMANTSHELRTPINTVSGMCEILLQKKLPDDIHSSVLDIQMTGVELQDIVTDIMDYAALEADTLELSPRSYSITSTLNDVMNMTVFENREKQLEIIFDCDPNIPRLLEGDEQQLRRVLNNLISNAIKFTSEGGVLVQVSYRTEDYGINLIVTVKDTGVGIGLDEQETILRGFYQSDSDRNRKSSGMGLGLTISSALIKKMGGFLTVKSQKGKGSEFTFAIPQKVLDNQPCISLLRPAMIKLIWYYKSQSSIPTIRDSFVEHIKHFSDYFGISSQQTSSLEECKRRVSQGQGVHLVIGRNEYLEDKPYFDDIAGNIPVILVAERTDAVEVGSDIHVLYKPYNAMMLAEIFNGRDASVPSRKQSQKKFTAPDAKVLVVDDNLMNLKVVEGLLRKYKIKIVAASSGEEALNLIDSRDYDFVFMDHMMPGMDGVECFHHIRDKQGPYFEEVPIIALTANAIAGSREMFLSEGFNDFIAKPVDSALLNEVLLKFIPAEKQIFDEEDEEKPVEKQEKKKEKKEEKEEKTQPLPTQEYPKATLPDRTAKVKKNEGSAFKDDDFDQLTSIDKETALLYCDTLDDFRELAQVYCSSGKKYVKELGEACDEKDLEKYRLLSHTIKSTSRTLGALRLSDIASEQESAAREKSEDRVFDTHEEFLSEYHTVLNQLSDYLRDDSDPIRKPVDPGESTEIEDWDVIKEEMLTCLKSFESGTFERIYDSIKDRTLDGVPMEEALSGVKEKAASFDFEGAVSELKGIGGKA